MVDLQKTLQEWARDDSIVRWFMSVWPMLQSLFDAFARSTGAPIFVYMNGVHLYQSPQDTMPSFCRLMLSVPITASMCVRDAAIRADSRLALDKSKIQACHAGMLNARRDVYVGHLGTMVILFGARRVSSEEAARKRAGVLEEVERVDPNVAGKLRAADLISASDEVAEIELGEIELIDAIAAVSERLLDVTLGAHWSAVNMAHEISNLMLTGGLTLKRLGRSLGRLAGAPESQVRETLEGVRESIAALISEQRLGLYVVRNFLSHASETRYKEAVDLRQSRIDLEAIVMRVAAMYREAAAAKGITIKIGKAGAIPRIVGFEDELERAVHNALSNAVKYSYRSIPNQHREINIFVKNPYDPGFRRRRFAICFENYGFAVMPDELPRVMRPGVRGKQAVKEVPIGSGIGLSEIAKIMKLHGGEARLKSKEMSRGSEDESSEGESAPYLTRLDLIFPYAYRRRRDA